MNTKYVNYDWITNATVNYLAPRTMISFRKWFLWSYENMTNIIITIPIFFTVIFWNTLRESNTMETNIGIICSDHFVELHHEILNWDLDEIREMCWYIVLMVFGYQEFHSSKRIFPRHHFSSNHWELQYYFNYECLSCLQSWVNSIIDSSSSTLIKCLIEGIDTVFGIGFRSNTIVSGNVKEVLILWS